MKKDSVATALPLWQTQHCYKMESVSLTPHCSFFPSRNIATNIQQRAFICRLQVKSKLFSLTQKTDYKSIIWFYGAAFNGNISEFYMHYQHALHYNIKYSCRSFQSKCEAALNLQNISELVRPNQAFQGPVQSCTVWAVLLLAGEIPCQHNVALGTRKHNRSLEQVVNGPNSLNVQPTRPMGQNVAQ